MKVLLLIEFSGVTKFVNSVERTIVEVEKMAFDFLSFLLKIYVKKFEKFYLKLGPYGYLIENKYMPKMNHRIPNSFECTINFSGNFHQVKSKEEIV